MSGGEITSTAADSRGIRHRKKAPIPGHPDICAHCKGKVTTNFSCCLVKAGFSPGQNAYEAPCCDCADPVKCASNLEDGAQVYHSAKRQLNIR